MKAYAKGNNHVQLELERGESGSTIAELVNALQESYPGVYMETPTIINTQDNDIRNRIIITINSRTDEENAEHHEAPYSYQPVVPPTDEQHIAPSPLKQQVINPDYYDAFRQKYGIDLIDIICDMPFDLGSSIKYLFRNGLKVDAGSTDRETAVKDLNKAITYIKHYIEHVMHGECLYSAGV